MHAMRGGSRTPPMPVPMPGEYSGYAEFCDWTEDSRLLVIASAKNGEGVLSLIQSDGRFVRTIPTTMPPARGSVAAYRKYEHR